MRNLWILVDSTGIGGAESRAVKVASYLSDKHWFNKIYLLVNRKLYKEYLKHHELKDTIKSSKLILIPIYKLMPAAVRWVYEFITAFFRLCYQQVKNRNVPDWINRIILKQHSWFGIIKRAIPEQDIIQCIYGDEARNGCLFLAGECNSRKIIIEITSNRQLDKIFHFHVPIVLKKYYDLNNLYIRCVSETVYKNSINILSELFFTQRNISISYYRGAFINITSPQIERNKKNIIIFPHRFIGPKNVVLFCEVVNDLLDNNQLKNWKIYFRGKGPLEEHIRLTLDSYIESGQVEVGFSYTLNEEFAETKIFISIITTGNYNSNSMYEAMRNGNLLLLSDTGITRKYLTHPDIVYTSVDFSELKEKLIFAVEICESSSFPAISNRMRKYFHDIQKDNLYIDDLSHLFRN